MDCLNCATPMHQRQHEGVTIDECPSCWGVWLDRGELRLIAEREIADRPPHEEEAELSVVGDASGSMRTALAEQWRTCPLCQRRMEKLSYDSYSGVLVDSCAEHGVFLDRGELERVEAYAEGVRARDRAEDDAARAGGTPPPAPDRNFLSGIALWESMQGRR